MRKNTGIAQHLANTKELPEYAELERQQDLFDRALAWRTAHPEPVEIPAEFDAMLRSHGLSCGAPMPQRDTDGDGDE